MLNFFIFIYHRTSAMFPELSLCDGDELALLALEGLHLTLGVHSRYSDL